MERSKWSYEDIAWWNVHVEKYFPKTGRIDREVMRMTFPRLGKFRPETVKAALQEWISRYGGENGRLFVGPFLAHLAERDESQRRELLRISVLASAEAERLSSFREREEIERERDEMREVISNAGAAVVDRSLEYLRECGWGSPPTPAVDAWPARWVIVVHDLIVNRPWPDIHADPIVWWETEMGSDGRERPRRHARPDNSPTIPVREAVRTARPSASGLFR